MRRYRSHKEVNAMQIGDIRLSGPARIVRDAESDGPGATLIALDHCFDVAVSETWMTRHQPQVGGYFVQYPDGYTSYSPKEAFESGYTEIA